MVCDSYVLSNFCLRVKFTIIVKNKRCSPICFLVTLSLKAFSYPLCNVFCSFLPDRSKHSAVTIHLWFEGQQPENLGYLLMLFNLLRELAHPNYDTI